MAVGLAEASAAASAASAVGAGRLVVARVGQGEGQVGGGDGQPGRVARGGQRGHTAVGLQRRREVAGEHGHVPQGLQRGRGGRVRRAAADLDTAPGQVAGLLEPAVAPGAGGRGRVGDGQSGVGGDGRGHPGPPGEQVAVEPPVGESGHGRGEPRREVELAGVPGPAPRGPQVVQPPLDPVRPGRLVGAVQPGLGPFGQVDHEAGVPAPEAVGLVGGKPGGGVGAQGLQHPVAADAAGARPRQHGPLGEPGHQVGDPAGGEVVAGRDRLRRRDVEAGREHRQAQEQPLLVGAEQLEGPVDHGPERLVAGVAVAAAGAEQVEAGVEPVGEVVDGQGADPGGGELDGQGEAVEGAADVADPGQEPLPGRDPGVGGAGPVQEQPDRGAAHLLGAGRGDLQRRDDQDPLAARRRAARGWSPAP